MRAKLVVGNWKMNGSLGANGVLLAALASRYPAGSEALCAVCVPAPYFGQVRELLANSAVAWGAQNVSEHGKGAFTGEVSLAMLEDFDCRYVIVGHSERRSLYGETDAVVAAKIAALATGKVVPILCIGETLAERESGATVAVVSRQLDAVIDRVGIAAFSKLVLAYEPVWAIGTGRTASVEQVRETHASIRSHLARLDPTVAAAVRILYGGSVKAANAAELFALDDVDGGLIGGASLVAEEFLAICAAASQPKVQQ